MTREHATERLDHWRTLLDQSEKRWCHSIDALERVRSTCARWIRHWESKLEAMGEK